MSLIPLKSFHVSLAVPWSFTWVTASASSLVTLIEDHPSIYSATSGVMFLQCESCHATSLLKGLEQSLILRLKSKLLNMAFKDFCGLTPGLSIMNQTTLHFTACILVLVQCFYFSIYCILLLLRALFPIFYLCNIIQVSAEMSLSPGSFAGLPTRTHKEYPGHIRFPGSIWPRYLAEPTSFIHSPFLIDS